MDEKMNAFLLDENVHLAMDYGKNRNIFDILDLDEIRHSRMLAWLLDPREGHLQGDYFLKALMREAFCNKERVQNSFFESWEPADLEAYSFDNAIVFTELSIGGNNKRRIDVAILDPANQVAIFIENKTGSSEGKEQTFEYFQELKNEYKSFNQVFIFMDMYEKNANDVGNWVNIGYSWLMNSIDRLLNRDVLPQEVEGILNQYHESISEQWGESLYFKKPYDLLSTVAKEHKDFIAHLKTARRSFEMKNLSDLENNKLLCLYKKHGAFINCLLEYSGFEFWVEKVSKEIGIELEGDHKKDGFYIHANDWESFYVKGYQWWGIQLSIKHTKSEGEQKRSTYNITIKIYPPAFKNETAARNIAIKRQQKLKRRGRDYIFIDLKEAVEENDLVAEIKTAINIVHQFIKKYQKTK